MPKKYRKMLTDWQAPYILPILKLIETQSQTTIHRWCVDYAIAHLLPIFEKECPADPRPRLALLAITDVKPLVKDCTAAAKDAIDNPIAHTTAKAIGQCVATAYNPTASAGLIFYGALAIAYAKAGSDAPWEALEAIAAQECDHIMAALQSIAIADEPNPAKIKWEC